MPIVPQTHRVAHFIRLAAHRAKRGIRAQRRHFHFYKSPTVHSWLRSAAAAPLSWRRRHWAIVASLLVFTAAIGIFAPRWANATRDSTTEALTTLSLDLPPLV